MSVVKKGLPVSERDVVKYSNLHDHRIIKDNLCAGGGQEDGNFDDQVIDLIYKQIQQDDHANKECDTRHIDALFTVSALLLILYKKHNQTLILIAGLITFGFLVAKIKTNLVKTYVIMILWYFNAPA